MTPETIGRNEPALLPLFPRLISATLLQRGFDEASLFQGLPFGSAELQQERFRLSIAEHEQFVLRVLEVTGDPHFALQLYRDQDPASYNLTILAIANSGQIARALQAITRYFKTITRVFSIVSVDTDERATMDLHVHLEHDRVIFFALMAFGLYLDRFFSEPLGGGHLLERIELPMREPADFAAAAHRYPFAVTFAGPVTRLHFRPELLDTSMPQADPATVRMLQEVSERQLQEAEAESSLSGRLRWLLVNRVASPPRLDDAAGQLGVSARSLRRKLAEEGTSFQALLDEVRCRTASRLLQASAAPVASIAYEMGFASPSDFGRAFRRWTGVSPAAYRAGQR